MISQISLTWFQGEITEEGSYSLKVGLRFTVDEKIIVRDIPIGKYD